MDSAASRAIVSLALVRVEKCWVFRCVTHRLFFFFGGGGGGGVGRGMREGGRGGHILWHSSLTL